MKPTAAQLRQLRRDNLQWPTMLKVVPRETWPPESASPYRLVANTLAPRVNVWRSRQFLVQAFDEGSGIIRLSVNRTEWDERQNRFREDIGWDDLQRLKGEAGYADRWAVEVFPPDSEVVNVANMRHVWLLADAPAFAWQSQKRVAA